MKINEEDIIRAACQLRDEDNEQLYVRPWNRRRRFHIPAWLAAVPAAAVVGFVLGVWTNAAQKDAPSLTALVDTVYITVPDRTTSCDTSVSISPVQVPTTLQKPQPHRAAKMDVPVAVGKSVADDMIRYDLLVMN